MNIPTNAAEPLDWFRSELIGNNPCKAIKFDDAEVEVDEDKVDYHGKLEEALKKAENSLSLRDELL